MDKREDLLRQLRADFARQWQIAFPSAPNPPVRALSSLRFSEDSNEGNTVPPSSSGGVPFDEWIASGAVEQLANSLRITEEKISQLNDQLARKTYLRDYLCRILECLDDSAVAAARGEVHRSRPLPVNNFVPSVLDPTVTVPPLSQEGSHSKHVVSTGILEVGEGQTSGSKLGSIKGLKKVRPRSEITCESPTSFSSVKEEEEEQTTVSRGRVVGPVSDLAAGDDSSVISKSAETHGEECISGPTPSTTRSLRRKQTGPPSSTDNNSTLAGVTATRGAAQPAQKGSQGRDRCVVVSVNQQPPGYGTRCNNLITGATQTLDRVRDGKKNTYASTTNTALCGRSLPSPPNRGELYETWERRRQAAKGIIVTTKSTATTSSASKEATSVITDNRSNVTTAGPSPKTVSTHSATLPLERGANRWRTPGGGGSTTDTKPPWCNNTTQARRSLPERNLQNSRSPSPKPSKNYDHRRDGTSAGTISFATQTDITFSLKHGWLVALSDAGDTDSNIAGNSSSTMQFWNRKKSAGKRAEEVRDRDNSGVLGRYSPVDLALATPPTQRRVESLPNRNVQYLQLTDGFNIVLGSDPAPTPGRSPQLPPKQQHHRSRQQQQPVRERNDFEDSNDEEVYDNNTENRRPSREETATLLVRSTGDSNEWQVNPELAKRRGSEDVNAWRRDPLRTVTPPPPHLSSSPQTPPLSSFGGHAPVSRASSDTAAAAATTRETADVNNSQRSWSKPHPQPRRKVLPVLPEKQKPTSVFYVTSTQQQEQGASLVHRPNSAGLEGLSAEWARGDDKDKVTETTTGLEEEGEGDRGVCSVERDRRGPFHRHSSDVDTGALPRHGHDDNTVAGSHRVQSVSAHCFTNDSPSAVASLQQAGTSITATTAIHSTLAALANRTRASDGNQESTQAIITVISVTKGDTSTSTTTTTSSTFFPTTCDSQSATSTSLVHSTDARQGGETKQLLSDSGDGVEVVATRVRQDRVDLSSSVAESQEGVGGLCRASALGAVQINQSLSRAAAGADCSSGVGSGETVRGEDNAAATNMLRFHSHTLTKPDNAEKNKGDRSPAVYRKMDETVTRLSMEHTPPPPHSESAPPFPRGGGEPREGGGHREGDKQRMDGEDEEVVTPTAPCPDDYEFDRSELTEADLTPQPAYHETDLDSPFLRPKKPPPTPPKPPKKPKVNTYENWTINRAVTQPVDTDDDEDTDSSIEDAVHRISSTSVSKDSGLCLDNTASTATTSSALSESVADAGAGAVAVAIGGGSRASGMGQRSGLDSSRISSIEELNRMHDEDADYVNLSFANNNFDYPDQEDNECTAVASDFTYIPGSEVSHGNQTSSTASDDDDEDHDSPPSVDSSYDDADGGDSPSALSPRDSMLKMRYLLVTGVLETEETYLGFLGQLLDYKRILEALCQTSQPVVQMEDIASIFSNLDKLHVIHKEFVDGLRTQVEHWSPEQTVGDVFKCLVVMFPEFGKYAVNYPNAVATIRRCTQEGQQKFRELAQNVNLSSTTTAVTSLEDALFKPVQRLQRNTLVLYDLIKHTPEDHPDHETLQKALNLSQHNLENFGTKLVPGQGVEENRHLVKSSFLVELVNGCRKLRYIFLFSDILICTKREQHRGGRVTFDCKWFIPMNVLNMDTKFSYQDDMKFSKKDEIDELKRKLRSLKTEIKNEMKKEETKEKHWSITGMASSRTIDKLKKKIDELQPQLILASPKLPFKVSHDSGKTHTLIMTTDYEREEWREAINSLRRKSVRRVDADPPSALEAQDMVNSVKELPQVNKIGNVLTDRDEEVVYGTLNVTIHKLNGLKTACDTYCCLEMDSYGHFFMKARTHICKNSVDPSWNEDFELELEGSQTLRILCYRGGPDQQGDILLGRGALEMSNEWLKGTFQETTVAMNEYSLVLSVRYTKAEKTMQRTPSKQNTAVFGARISQCARREGKTVPTIVTTCVQEVERRGMDETGIYRVSGVTSDVQKLKKHFDKNSKTVAASLGDVDIHSVTGVLKLYFRELPEPLFTEDSYSYFVDALKLSDEEGKEKCMLSLLHKLPDINYYTAVYLLEHLLKVSRSEKENKMSIHNLSTIFGPTLLAPATKSAPASMTEMMSLGAEQCMKQSAIIFHFLSLLAKGVSLRRSSTQS